MKYRISLTLALVAGCSDVNIDLGESDGSQGSTAAQSSSDETPTTGGPGAPGPTDTTDATDTAGTDGDSEQGGSQSASQSGSETTADTADAGTSSTGDPGTTGTTGESSTGELETTTGAVCVPKAGGPAPVVLGPDDDLGTPGAYAVLAKTAITSVPGTLIDGGHVGISPAAATAITGFALVLDPSGVYATSPTVMAPFRVHAADYAVPTPTLLTTAVLGMEAAYTDAAGRVPTDYLDLESGKIGGLTLEPGIYTWGGTVLVTADLTLSGCEDDVWILQIAGDLDVATANSVLLAGGARAENVFWQVAGQATIRADAHFEGIILSKTGITFQTDAALHGRALAQTMVAFDKNMVTAP